MEDATSRNLSESIFQLTPQVMYRYERDWSSRAQNHLLWRFLKLLYTELTLQYLGAAFMVRVSATH